MWGFYKKKKIRFFVMMVDLSSGLFVLLQPPTKETLDYVHYQFLYLFIFVNHFHDKQKILLITKNFHRLT